MIINLFFNIVFYIIVQNVAIFLKKKSISQLKKKKKKNQFQKKDIVIKLSNLITSKTSLKLFKSLLNKCKNKREKRNLDYQYKTQLFIF